jgi:hypothetical protein
MNKTLFLSLALFVGSNALVSSASAAVKENTTTTTNTAYIKPIVKLIAGAGFSALSIASLYSMVEMIRSESNNSNGGYFAPLFVLIEASIALNFAGLAVITGGIGASCLYSGINDIKELNNQA